MQIVNIHEAKSQLSKLTDKAANGEPFLIAKARKPLVKVSAIIRTIGLRFRWFLTLRRPAIRLMFQRRSPRTM
jgi:antitoxin (DNA-binding transcriptional repressor) of toxin-antitoxin stability system